MKIFLFLLFGFCVDMAASFKHSNGSNMGAYNSIFKTVNEQKSFTRNSQNVKPQFSVHSNVFSSKHIMPKMINSCKDEHTRLYDSPSPSSGLTTSTIDKEIKLVSEKLEVPIENIKSETSSAGDLGANSSSPSSGLTTSTIDKVIKLVSEKLEVPIENIKPESSFAGDLGADSLDTVELVMKMEEEFKISIPDEVANKLVNIQNAVDLIDELLKHKA